MASIWVPKDYRLVTAKVNYYLPDFPNVLTFLFWQKVDVWRECPELKRFLEFWKCSIDGRLHSVQVGATAIHEQLPIRHASIGFQLH